MKNLLNYLFNGVLRLESNLKDEETKENDDFIIPAIKLT